MAAAKKKKTLTYRSKPLYRVGNRIYYGNLDDKYILALDIVEQNDYNENLKISSKVKIQLMDNSQGKLGEGQIYRKAERDDLYHALDIGEWWLKDALQLN